MLTDFLGTVDLHDFSLADLVGLAHAHSWSYQNDMLSIKNLSGKVIDRLHIVSDAATTGSVRVSLNSVTRFPSNHRVEENSPCLAI